MVTIHRRTDKLPTGALLASVGGFLDAYTLTRHGVFANLQSGNVVLFCVQVTSRHWHAAALRLVPVAAFIIGALAVELLGTPRAVTIVRRPIRLVLTIEIALLTALAALPGDVPAPVTTVTVSFVAALQFSTFTTLDGAPYATLMTTGNLRQCVVAVHQCLTRRDRASARRAQLYGVIVAAFSSGALVGVICTRRFGEPAIAVAAGLLLGVLALLIRESRQWERASGEASANT
ncbi:YoaK family protein [Kitasatospora sp. CM 4170]|uniref:YoaK family protein n=1 Tax=Kitasatospora aburaviensis TaxID=67265 RepID=A0ABW1F7Y0_9ACTN|nr:YoaK family protein [Kitasatospora sp. CM 4170]WNM43387.1 YoaK family protein [Kitasatospora sp. CM 4170]